MTAEPAQGVLFASGERRVARVRRGVDVQLRALQRSETIGEAQAGYVALARTLADAVDSEWLDRDGSRFTVGALAARLAAVLDVVTGDRADAGAAGEADAELARLTAEIRDAARSGPSDDRP